MKKTINAPEGAESRNGLSYYNNRKLLMADDGGESETIMEQIYDTKDTLDGRGLRSDNF